MLDSSDQRRHRRTHLFTVRLWIEPIGKGRAEVRGRVQHVLSGEVSYFRILSNLIQFFVEKLIESESEEVPDEGE